jgi:hypothetical protein
MFFTIDTRDVKKLQREMAFFGDKLHPKAQANALNRGAFETRQKYAKASRRKFTIRNRFTERSIQFEKVKGLNPRNQVAVVGSTADYMLDQEFGTTITKTGKHGVDIPTSSASGEGPTATPRRRVVRRANLRGSITLQRRRIKARSKKQYIVSSIKATAKQGGRNRFLYLPFDRHPGIYKVMGGKRKPRIVLMHDFSKPSVVIQARRPLKQSVDIIAPRVPGYYVKSARFQLKRAGLIR